MTQIPKTEAEVASIVREIDEKGFSIMEGAIPAAFLDEILAEIDRLQKRPPRGDIHRRLSLVLLLVAGSTC